MDEPAVASLQAWAHISRALLLRTMACHGEIEVEVEAAGAEVTLADGRRLIDFGSYAVALLGHRPPAVVAALEHQLHRLPTSTRSVANGFARPSPSDCAPSWFGLGRAGVVRPERQRRGRVWLKLAHLASGRTDVLALEQASSTRTRVASLLGRGAWVTVSPWTLASTE